MPRISEIPPHQRHSHRVPLRLKSTASSEANSLHRTAGIERSSKLEDRSSSRIVLEEKKRGLRLADLEKKLDQTMEELKKLKEQLASAEAAKTVVENKLEKVEKAAVFPLSTKTLPNPEDVDEVDEKDKLLPAEKDSDSCITSDVDEIAASCCEDNASKPEIMVTIEKTSRSEEKGEGEVRSKHVVESTDILEMAKVRAKLAEQAKKLETVVAEKESLEKEAGEAKAALSISGMKTEEMEIKLAETEEELKQSKSLVLQLKQKLDAEEVSKASMEAEMKLLRIQTDQWRKASEAAASILYTGDESFRSALKPLESGNFLNNGVLWSPLVTGAEVAEGQDGQKKRGSGSGIRVFGELWKRKGQQK
ncbi:interactor of constitutive active ROPs 1-like [Phalaenopsis equestris]|uniref:interactor of constitutive active ROPs 1-like n=1 Tax=Phalaenopsis equestris TaxID=78828 RepID=UPI0009E411AE|nr:interactor of constitutive active ROPs 1-like [Phalaenopsis equestris]